MKSRLEQYFNFFIKNTDIENWLWYKSMKHWTNLLQGIKQNISSANINSLEELNSYLAKQSSNEIIDYHAFLDRYLFMQDNGTANIGQGFIYKSDTNPHRQNIIEKIENDYTILLNILKKDNPKEVSQLIKDLINIDGRGYDAVRFRFLKTLFPDQFTSVDSPGKLDRLVSVLKDKLSITVKGNNHIEQHKWLMDQLKNIKNDNYKKQIFYWELYYMLENNWDLKKAIVYYGAPGTGKTYKAKEEAKKFIDSWGLKTFTQISDDKKLIETVQFHPSFGYEDFIEGIRPSKDKELKLKAGIFKKFCKKVGSVEIKLYKNSDYLKQFKDRKFSDIKISDIKTINSIEDALPKINDYADDLTLQDVIQPAFFIIDEINRAELSRVFGELMYSLEYRGYNGKIKTQYSYLNENENDESVFFWENNEDWFFIPQNVYIIGTMNTIDRSVDSFDFALRRRFMWEEILPDYDVIKAELNRKLSDNNNLGDKLSESFKKLNEVIKNESLLGNDYQIGHSYALNIKHKSFEKLQDAKNFLWGEFIKSLMQEYLRGLGDNTKSNEMIAEFKKIFGAN